MSLYFTTLFALLTIEMVTLFMVVLPLPFRIRRIIYKAYYKWSSNTQVKTVYYIFGGLVGLLFIDSWKRAQVKVSLYHHKKYSDGSTDPSAVTPIQALASRAYNQRNVYISGFILYFMVCIPTVMTIVRRLIKYQNLINEQNEKHPEDAQKKQIVENKEINELREKLREKEVSLQGLQKQVKNLEEYFDKQNANVVPDSERETEKKEQ
ncbi:hypothetical protein HG535_0C05610 [Zygotorulaspora mrakii]|uniref:Endoplasmic reticulum transmembrane protein n=1 Tax=Zygotorulaspora mrakii TaxID=42260 RepID=A0A7H9B140_ZYGMR|nr:uncharacterized protein HG535_0C05610 [Zygotorulaspora mrakii]QLG72207.1 hypothetical protein HG535_0C05610 [Zygotorulaspora mrakii]